MSEKDCLIVDLYLNKRSLSDFEKIVSKRT